MTRWLLAALALAAPLASARAEYVYLRMIIGGDRQAQQQTGGQPAQPGGGQNPGGGQPGNGQDSQDNQDNARTTAFHVQAVIECKTIAQPPLVQFYRIKHKYGASSLFTDGKLLIANILPVPGVKEQMIVKHANAYKNKSPSNLFDHGEWLLNHGLVDEFAKYMDELVTAKEGGSLTLTNAIEAYKKIKPEIAKVIEKDDVAKRWHTKLGLRKQESDHYVLLFNAAGGTPAEVEQRVTMLEQNFRAFYYWWALKGIALPMPAEKQVAVLLDSTEDFRQRIVLEDEILASDGYFATRDNVVVFSTQRLDLSAYALSRTTQALWQSGWNRADLLAGKGARKSGGQVSPDEVRRLQTIALLDRAVEEEGERASVSHEGCRQLMVASGLHAKNVLLPQWLQFGMGAFFETPKGPFTAANGPSQVAFYPGVGGPSWAYSRLLRRIIRPESLEGSPELLLQVVDDDLFNSVYGASDYVNLLKARSTAWGLCYYLARTKAAGMVRFYQELAQLPRDLELEPKAVRGCFGRAFDCGNINGTDIDPAKFGTLAKDWVAFVGTIQPPGAEFGLDAPQSTTPGQPNGAPANGGNRPGGGRPGGR